ncbi:MAG: bifunctional diaminohydroxyphosphoribosylaminopyrimidine deaminase/5-amino-6-(5-phosphoribosylamino)uracil reductase RibD [Pirellulales bacterium]|nr:bifunctional diaminohydroxyphosphoribosylaminopyrimidine deaminase/5-amino-6-(5-phosphoribosylamino)uracil reductase RibD [Pirellulales bacterium]
MQPLPADEPFMRKAIDLAKEGLGHVEPNPMVGCVIVRDQTVLGAGYHEHFGGPHAEVRALAACGEDAEGATAYVTLEPCCHHGKTPPCADALIKAGIQRVVVAMEDPFPQVDGGGLRQLAAAGIQVDVGVMRDEAESLNAAYLKRVGRGMPWVIAKWAMTADGRIATSAGESQWITGPASRAEVHRLRGRVDAIAVGMGTVEADDPLLTARPPGPRLATRVVFCKHRLPKLDSRLVQSADAGTVLLVASPLVRATEPIRRLRDRGVEVLDVDSAIRPQMILAALREFGRRRWTNVMVEGGSELLASFWEADQIDECHVYLGAKVFGGAAAPGPIGGQGVGPIADAWPLEVTDVSRFAEDVRIVYRRSGTNHPRNQTS